MRGPIRRLRALHCGPTSIGHTLSIKARELPNFIPSRGICRLSTSFSASMSGAFNLGLYINRKHGIIIDCSASSRGLIVSHARYSSIRVPGFDHVTCTEIRPMSGGVRLRVFMSGSDVRVFTGSKGSMFALLACPNRTRANVRLFTRGGKAGVRLST